MDLAWCPPIVGELINLAELRYLNGGDFDADFHVDEDEAMDFQVAQALSDAAEESGIILPDEDAYLVSVLDRDAKAAPPQPRMGVVLQQSNGALALGIGRGMTVESAGESLALIERPESGRYVKAWFIPGVFYWEEH